MPETNVHPHQSKLCRIIQENLPGASIIAGSRKDYREDSGMDYINQVPHLSDISDYSSRWKKT
jgi:hypothetical protein